MPAGAWLIPTAVLAGRNQRSSHTQIRNSRAPPAGPAQWRTLAIRSRGRLVSRPPHPIDKPSKRDRESPCIAPPFAITLHRRARRICVESSHSHHHPCFIRRPQASALRAEAWPWPWPPSPAYQIWPNHTLLRVQPQLFSWTRSFDNTLFASSPSQSLCAKLPSCDDGRLTQLETSRTTVIRFVSSRLSFPRPWTFPPSLSLVRCEEQVSQLQNAFHTRLLQCRTGLFNPSVRIISRSSP
jgi:hypothetical protein